MSASIDRPTLRVGESLRLAIALRNQHASAWVVRITGTFSGVPGREPPLYAIDRVELQRADGAGQVECRPIESNMFSIEDWMRLDPGATHQESAAFPSDFWRCGDAAGWARLGPGRYLLRVVYRIAREDEQWSPAQHARIAAMSAPIWEGEILSDPIELTIQP